MKLTPYIMLVVSVAMCAILVGCSSSETPIPVVTKEQAWGQSPLPTPTVESASTGPTMEAASPLPTPEIGSMATLTGVPEEPPVPMEGTASVIGVLYTPTGGGPIPETAFYLTPGIGAAGDAPPGVLAGPRAEDGDVAGVSESSGGFVVNNIPPGSYYLAVWAPYNWILASQSDQDQTPRLITLEADQQLDLGVVHVSWP